MTVSDLLELFTQVSFVVLGAATFIDFLRHRDYTRRDIMLMVNAIGLVTALQLFTMATGLEFLWMRTLAVFALVAQPYLLLRLVRYFKTVHTAISWSAVVSMVVCFALVAYLVNTDSPPAFLAILIIGYFVVFNGYAMVAFIRGAFTTAGVVRQRLRFGAIGSGLFALALLIAGIDSIIPLVEPITDPIYRLVAVTSALAYYVGFVPPRWLRRTWQHNELREYLLLIGKPSTQRMSEAEHIRHLMLTARTSVGAAGSLVATTNNAGPELTHLHFDPVTQATRLDLDSSEAVKKAWNERAADFVRKSSRLGGGDLKLIEAFGARTMLIVPVDSAEQRWGLLLVFLKHDSLFIQDDLELLALLAQQSAMVLENNSLIDALQASNEELEHRVEERTLELREAFDQIQRLNEELEERVVERTAQLTTVNKELEAFTYSVSHDLRAPLRGLDGFSEALLEDYFDQLDDDAKHYLSRIRSASQRMGQLIDDLLQLSRMSRAELNLAKINLSEAVLEVSEEVRERWPNHPVELIIQYGLEAKGDARLVRIALNNILDNAWKFSANRDDARVEFGATNCNGEQAYFIRDNGAGFNMDYSSKMFGAFQRLHSGYEFEGTGIGLAIVQRILNRHGGNIWAEGKPGKGASFYFTLS